MNIRETIIRIARWKYLDIVASGVLAGLICIFLYGAAILNPTNTEWLYSNGDISQHQIGWEFFRFDSWHIPLGAIKTLAYPEGTSVVYMDSIPIAAIFTKLLSPILPQTFQYFGLWGFMSFVLQGVFGAFILRKFTKNKLLVILGSLFFVTAPYFLVRTYGHTALASQFILLLGICFVLYRHRLTSLPKSVIAWTGLMALSATVHPYFVPMTGILLVIYLILQKSSWKSILAHLVSGGLIAVACFWMVGGFVTKDVGTATLGLYGADINALINPITFSRFLKPFDSIPGAYEGLAYLGLGVYLLLILLAVWFFASYKAKKKLSVKNIVKKNGRYLLVGLVVILSIFLAIGPVFYLNGQQLIVLSPPDAIAQIMSIFRSSGRFIWIACYALLILALGGILYAAKKLKISNTKVIVLFVILLGVQVLDVVKSPGMNLKRDVVRDHMVFNSHFNTDQVKQMLDRKTRVAYTSNSLHGNNFFEIGPLVTARKMPINDGYISRKPVASVNKETAQAYNELVSGNLRADTVYISDVPVDIDRPDVETIKVSDTYLIALR